MPYLGRPSEQVEALTRAATALDQIVRRSQTSEVVAQGARRILLAVARRNIVVEGAIAEALDIACVECLAALRAEHAPTMKQHIAQDGHDDPWRDDDGLAKEEFMSWLVDCVQSAPASTSLEIPTIAITPPPLNLADVPTDDLLEHAFGHIQKCRLEERAELCSLPSTSASPLSLSRVTSVSSLTEMQQPPTEWDAVNHFAVEPIECNDLKVLAVEPVEDDDLDPWEAEFLARCYLDQHFSQRKIV